MAMVQVVMDNNKSNDPWQAQKPARAFKTKEISCLTNLSPPKLLS